MNGNWYKIPGGSLSGQQRGGPRICLPCLDVRAHPLHIVPCRGNPVTDRGHLADGRCWWREGKWQRPSVCNFIKGLGMELLTESISTRLPRVSFPGYICPLTLSIIQESDLQPSWRRLSSTYPVSPVQWVTDPLSQGYFVLLTSFGVHFLLLFFSKKLEKLVYSGTF